MKTQGIDLKVRVAQTSPRKSSTTCANSEITLKGKLKNYKTRTLSSLNNGFLTNGSSSSKKQKINECSREKSDKGKSQLFKKISANDKKKGEMKAQRIKKKK